MDKLILFDIDGTLIKNAPGHEEAFSKGIQETYGITADWDLINPHGMTDQQILMEILTKMGLSKREIKAKLMQCMQAMVNHFDLAIKSARAIVFEGVAELLEELKQRDFLLGLVTGNLEPIARGKLVLAGLNHYFRVGGYGSDNIKRTVLVKTAIKRAEENFVFRFRNNVVLFGDAPQDMHAGKEAGIFTIGTATGIYSREDLQKAGACRTVENLKNTREIISVLTQQ
jgi:phosphoglycolate phosphatase-like HAD superfamily hydrolase